MLPRLRGIEGMRAWMPGPTSTIYIGHARDFIHRKTLETRTVNEARYRHATDCPQREAAWPRWDSEWRWHFALRLLGVRPPVKLYLPRG